MRRIPVVLVLVVCAWPLLGGVAHGSSTTNAAAAGGVRADFNGDGFADLAIGVPQEDIGGEIIDAGAVVVLYGSAGKLTGVGSQRFTENSQGIAGSSELGDRFGSALATGDFNQDGFADLAIGIGEEEVGGTFDGGAVVVLYGSARKLSGVGSQRFNQESPGVIGSTQEADSFGYALTTGDFNNDGFADLAVGVPFEDVGGVDGAGAVVVLYGSAGKLTGVGSQRFNENSEGVGGSPAANEDFGFALATGDFNNDGFADLAVGVPQEDVGTVDTAGAVVVLYGSAGKLTGVGSQLFHQDSAGVGSSAEENDLFGHTLATGDFNRDGFADLAVGAPVEDVGSTFNAGAVNVLYGSAGKLTGVGSQLFHQNSAGVGTGAEAGDFFGFALATGDFNRDGFADLAVGVQLEDIAGVLDAGAVNVLYGSAGKLTGVGSQLFHQDSAGVGTGAERRDNFGFALAAADFNGDTFDDLAVGVPFEDIAGVLDAGAVNVLYGSAGKLTGVGSQLFHEDSPGVGGGAEVRDQLGEALAASGPRNASASSA